MTLNQRLTIVRLFPKSNLETYKSLYYGYPLEILIKLWELVDVKREDLKIAVVDDFGLEAVNFLLDKGIQLDNLTMIVSDEKSFKKKKREFEKLINVRTINLINFFEKEKGYYIDNNMFDLIIANPPYEHSLHAKILQSIYSTCKNSKIIYLCPDSLLSGMSANCVNARKCTEEALSDYRFLGPVDFGDAKPVVSLFVFDLHSTEKKTFEDCRNSKRSEEEKSIRNKIDSVDCWDPYKLSKTYNFTTTYSKWDENKSGNFRDWLKQKLDFSNPRKVFIASTSALYYKQIAQVGEYPSYVAAYFQFETIEEANQFREVIKDPFYSQILKIYSTNKRDLYPRQAKWPKSIEALNLTEKELEFVNGL